MTYQWQESMKARRAAHLAKARMYRTDPPTTCTNPSYWASYHRGEAIKLARIINKWEHQS